MKNGCSTGMDLFKYCFDRTEFKDGFFGNSEESKRMLNEHNMKARFLKQIEYVDAQSILLGRKAFEKAKRIIQKVRNKQNELMFQYTVSDYYEDD